MNDSRQSGQVVSPDGNIVASMAEAFRARLKEALGQGATELTIDCSSVRMIDSVGIGLLIAAHNSLDKLGGKLGLRAVSPDIAKLLQAMRLDKHFRIYP